VRLEGIDQFMTSSGIELAACSIVPEPTTLQTLYLGFLCSSKCADRNIKNADDDFIFLQLTDVYKLQSRWQ
jgi:hypothetical protein